MTANATRIGIWGGSGSGKSTRAKEMMRSARRVVVFDPMEEYQREGFKPFSTIAGMGRHIAANLNSFRVCYVPPSGQEDEALSMVSKMCLDLQVGYKAGNHRAQLHLMTEELNLGFGSNISPKIRWFAELCSRGRHSGINLIGISQRPNEVNTRFRGNLEHLFVFRMIDHIDIDSLRKTLGPKYAEQIPKLAPHEFLYRGLDGKVKRGKNSLTR